MIEPPSPQLVQTLLGLKLCSATDLRRCRKRVKRLARDLPAFDTIWIDALLQARRLTPFQARLLDSANANQICVGPCVLIEKLGGRSATQTFLARQRDGNERCVLKLIDWPSDLAAEPLGRLNRLIDHTQPLAHPSIVAPRSALPVGEQIAVVSRFVPGSNLAQLLVRRGRFPANVVAEIGAQLIDGLAAAEACDYVHGDIRLANVRLTAQGAAVLVDFGVRPAIETEFSIHSTLTPEYCDGIAPELIGTGNAPSAASDFYALGCLMWQLLGGRPPFMTADPLAKLACHQTRRIPDVRDIAPDAPAEFAEAIQAYTNPDVSKRPQSFREARQQMKAPRRSGRSRLMEFSAQFNSAAPRIPIAASEPSASKWPLLVVLLFVLSGGALTLADKGAKSLPMSLRKIAQDWTERPREESPAPKALPAQPKKEKPPVVASGLLPLPAPDANGVIELTSDGPYASSRIDAAGSLTIRGWAQKHPVIIVEDAPLFLVAGSKVAVQNVHFRPKGTASRTSPLLIVRTQTLVAENCSFIGDGKAAANAGKPSSSSVQAPAMLHWEPVDANDRSARTVSLQNATFIGGAPAISLDSAPQTLHATNCLKVGQGPFLLLAHAPTSQQTFQTLLKQVTLRDADSLCDVRVAGATMPIGVIQIESNDSVFQFRSESSSLMHFLSDKEIKGSDVRVDVSGEGTIASRGFDVAAWINTTKPGSTPLSSETIVLDGILAVPFEFAGPADGKPQNSAVRGIPSPGPRRSTEAPGIDVKQLSVRAGTETARVD